MKVTLYCVKCGKSYNFNNTGIYDFTNLNKFTPLTLIILNHNQHFKFKG
jgi:hypothetical protein